MLIVQIAVTDKLLTGFDTLSLKGNMFGMFFYS